MLVQMSDTCPSNTAFLLPVLMAVMKADTVILCCGDVDITIIKWCENDILICFVWKKMDWSWFPKNLNIHERITNYKYYDVESAQSHKLDKLDFLH